MTSKRGHLVVVGGAEDREDDKPVLRRVTELAGGKKAHLAVLTTASQLAAEQPEVAREIEQLYETAFKDCGAARVTTLHIQSRSAANDPANVAAIEAATGIFMTGGDQARLVNLLGGTAVGEAMHRALAHRGACISGTSAGASALSRHMIAGGPSELLPTKGVLPLAPGLGFLENAIIDQHFSQRQRLGRLISVIAENPFLLGVGIDEDTALVIGADGVLEVVGAGSVTILDGRRMGYSNFNEVGHEDLLTVSGIQLHMFPRGFTFHGRARQATRGVLPEGPPDFCELVETLIGTCV